MNIIELQRSLRQLRLCGIADVLETRLRQAQAETMAPIDLISCLVSDELTRRGDRLLERRRKQAGSVECDPHRFDFVLERQFISQKHPPAMEGAGIFQKSGSRKRACGLFHSHRTPARANLEFCFQRVSRWFVT
jgi:hypothetical protein